MDDTELYRERILRHAGPVITGRFLGFRTSYTREVRVGQPLLIVVFVTASIAQALLALIRSGGGARRRFKDLKKGPEYLVTPVRLRDDLGQTYEVEMHGQLPQSALHRGDLVQVRTVPQKDPDLPVKLHQVLNLETLQPYTPRIPTMWSHLGPGLLIQAVLGLLVAGALAVAWIS
ncbi:hypothetical protein Asp14428_78550 [Actinoplanes sp. NBRC 14428]|uniref:Uncharacterized protein n=1 Tax=Pseudosporangium ferrugineum TaxID=439699 RepID=A0A2T0SJR7_9ACTN|nr:hypothetical protein [Pseudosporangium ferrugineum]PRY33666.1 hypothetical protein CLV70_101829 [Pseudosporangium ferrugineum]BCJ56380.1 hypothetical protein Asp14428_78550 [Actinoplanes sp. NBRC 14428]